VDGGNNRQWQQLYSYLPDKASRITTHLMMTGS